MWLTSPQSLAHFGLVISKTAGFREKKYIEHKAGVYKSRVSGRSDAYIL